MDDLCSHGEQLPNCTLALEFLKLTATVSDAKVMLPAVSRCLDAKGRQVQLSPAATHFNAPIFHLNGRVDGKMGRVNNDSCFHQT